MAINLNVVSKFDDKGIKQIQGDLGGLGKSLGKIGGLIAGAFSVVAIKNFANESILAAEGVQIANQRLGQIAESMGLFGKETAAVSDRLIKYAEANEMTLATDAEVIKATQAKLLTFKELANTADNAGGAFDRATKAAVDLAAAGFGSATTNAVQLGKALNDPIKGITALTRSGITFTAAEREKIKALTESGKVLEAQDLILKAIETQVGGTAAATASASEKMTLAFGNLKESVGAAILPAFEALSKSLIPIIEDLGPKLGKVFASLTPVITQLAGLLPSLIDALLPVAEVFAEFAVIILDIASDLMPVFIDVLEAIMPAVQALLPIIGEFLKDLIRPLVPALSQLISAFTPLLEMILPVLVELLETLLPIFVELLDDALIALIPVITELVAAFLPLLQSVLPILVNLLTDLVIPTIKTLGSIVVQVFGGAAKFIGEALGNTMTVLTTFAKSFEGVWTGIGKFLKGIINGMLGLIQGLVNGVIDGVNTLIKALNKIQFTVPSWIPGIGGASFGFAIPELGKIRIPQLAEGGIVMPQPGGTLANIAEAGRPEAVIPLDRMGNMGTTNKFTITVNAGMGADGTEIGRQIVDEIIRYEKSSGRVFARA
jgi:phage-related protein